MKHLVLIAFAQIRSQEWHAPLYEMDFWGAFNPCTVHSRKNIITLIDVCEDTADKIILSLN